MEVRDDRSGWDGMDRVDGENNWEDGRRVSMVKLYVRQPLYVLGLGTSEGVELRDC